MSGFDYKPINVNTPEVNSYSSGSSSSGSFTENVEKIEVETVEIDGVGNVKNVNVEIGGSGSGKTTSTTDSKEDLPKVNEIKKENSLNPIDKDMAKNIVDKGKYMCIDCDYDAIIDTLGGQEDNHGKYAKMADGCDNYARGYAALIQTGKYHESADLAIPLDGTTRISEDCEDRRAQAKCAFEIVKNTGRPCVIHVNSMQGHYEGHWLCVIGYEKGTTSENVSIENLVVIDSAAGTSPISAQVRFLRDIPDYCESGLSRCTAEPGSGYRVVHYEWD